ncbi:hypothetical protein AMATHDRAFT_142531 [Amanita thiersii Skay4041]|uniref:Uncharacterized protein n=1 Tax=Amanita thiersii Skay4041 TaxID=703135 RepID=A0A2A9NUS6_9AGAR|nr:hypothetical protein AMATHDRAFT_142531 [Amanita thiersii Skay4041]
MVPRHVQLYRSILSEVKKSATTPGKRNRAITAQLRAIAEKGRQPENTQTLQDLQNALLFFRSQREYKVLLHRYNPTLDLTSEERIKATANRVGLDMPVTS